MLAATAAIPPLSPLLRRIFQTEEMLGCPPPQLLNVTKASALQVLKETTKRRVLKIFLFGQDISPGFKKNGRALKCRSRELESPSSLILPIPATPNIYFKPRAISTHSICSWWLSFAPKRSLSYSLTLAAG